MGGDLMKTINNGSFENGWYHHDGRPELQIPNGFTFWDASDEGVPNQWDSAPYNAYVRPEVRVLPQTQVPSQEHVQFFVDGVYTVKIFKDWGASLTGLEFTQETDVDDVLRVPIFGDFVASYSPEKQYLSGGFVRAVVNRSPVTEWQEIAPGELAVYDFPLSLSAGDSVMVQFAMPYALMNSGIFTDGWHWLASQQPVSPPTDNDNARAVVARIRGLIAQLSASTDELEGLL